MKIRNYVRFSLSLLLMLALLSPVSVLAAAGGDGKKHFKQGMKHEAAEEWDKAAEEFALAVVDDPKNPEYRLHYVRALFNASQMYMKKGRALFDQKDYAGAYLAFRKAYAYDPTNELAKSEMEKMLRLQQGVENGGKPDGQNDANGTVKLVQTGYAKTALPDDVVVPQKLEKLRDVPFPSGVNLAFLIKELAKDLDLNVLLDAQSRIDGKTVKIELKNVTAAKALDYIFLQEGLFFQKVGPRTILVADQNRRQNFQQLVLRTFYLANANPKDVVKVVQQAIPAQPGRTPTIPLIDESTNSITVRDTSENIKIIANLIAALDKDRAEVVMDVAIYEVTKSDLLRLGNQIGNESGLTNLGGTTRGVVGIGGNDLYGGSSGTPAASIIPRAFGVGLVIPAVNLVAFNRKSDAKIIASTQIHAFNNEDSSARIGQRVPVQTAQLLGYNNQPGQQQNNFNFGNAASVVNYEQVGLTLKFKPIVFPNQDVQVAMEIESKDVAAGGTPENPVFTERTIKGTARIQNNKTLLLASVATGSEVKGREGLPLLGLIPILGRLFTAPTRNNSQVDIVIAITPRVIRAPAILPEDEVERPTGSLATPTSGSLEAMIIQEEIEEQLAAARRLPNTANVQLPDQPNEPTYVRSTSTQTNSSTDSASASQTSEIKQTETAEQNAAAVVAQKSGNPAINLKPIETGAKTLQITPTAGSAKDTINKVVETSLQPEEEKSSTGEPSVRPSAEFSLDFNGEGLKKGDKIKIPVMVKSETQFRSAVLGLNFDEQKIAVRSVTFGDVFGEKLVNTPATPFANKNGKMYVSLWTLDDVIKNSTGVLAYVEIEVLEKGKTDVRFDREILNLLTVDGKNFAVKY